MKTRLPPKSKIKFDDGTTVELVRGHTVRYADGEINSGFSNGLGEDKFFFRFARKDMEQPILIFARRDELEALNICMQVVLYVDTLLGTKPKRKK